MDWIHNFTDGVLAHEFIASLVICVNLNLAFVQFARHHDQQAGPAFLPALMAMLSSMTTVTASPQGPSVASEDEDREKWLDDKLRQISSLDYYDFLAFSQFNRR